MVSADGLRVDHVADAATEPLLLSQSATWMTAKALSRYLYIVTSRGGPGEYDCHCFELTRAAAKKMEEAISSTITQNARAPRTRSSIADNTAAHKVRRASGVLPEAQSGMPGSHSDGVGLSSFGVGESNDNGNGNDNDRRGTEYGNTLADGGLMDGPGGASEVGTFDDTGYGEDQDDTYAQGFAPTFHLSRRTPRLPCKAFFRLKGLRVAPRSLWHATGRTSSLTGSRAKLAHRATGQARRTCPL